MIVTRRSHPSLFKAFHEIDHDKGVVNRYTHEKTQYEVPPAYEEAADAAEIALSQLREVDLIEFCVGEQSVHDEEVNPIFIAAHNFLNAYFEDFPQGDTIA